MSLLRQFFTLKFHQFIYSRKILCCIFHVMSIHFSKQNRLKVKDNSESYESIADRPMVIEKNGL